MKVLIKIVYLLSLLSLLFSCRDNKPTQYDGWTLVWHDEFLSNNLKTSNWNIRNGKPLCQKGKLILNNNDEIDTRDLHHFRYSRIEIRAKLPIINDINSKIYTSGSGSLNFPFNGKIDILGSYKVGDKSHIYSKVVSGNEKHGIKEVRIPFSKFTRKTPNWKNEYHIWRMDWDQQYINIYIDGTLILSEAISSTVNSKPYSDINPFKLNQYIALAVNSNGKSEANMLKQSLLVDYIRVYQKNKTKYTSFHPGKLWLDNTREHINAHGGGVLYYKGKYYWYGENKGEASNQALVGVGVYSSTDLYNWTNEGIALKVLPENSGSAIEKGSIIERPKVVYNKKTNKFVMWFHNELKGMGYAAAEYGVAISDNPIGPFKYLYSSRSCAGKWPKNMNDKEIAKALSLKDMNRESFKNKDDWQKAIIDGMCLARDFKKGQMARDMNIFVDTDGSAYHIFSSEDNKTLHIAKLTDDYLYETGEYVRVLPGGHNEAPAIFKRNGKYWMITSGCTGWAPNSARLSSADNIYGPWKSYPNPCVGPKAKKTFGGQSTYILPVQGKKDMWIFMADIWTPKYPIYGKYIWLPIKFKNDIPVIEWQDEWKY